MIDPGFVWFKRLRTDRPTLRLKRCPAAVVDALLPEGVLASGSEPNENTLRNAGIEQESAGSAAVISRQDFFIGCRIRIE